MTLYVLGTPESLPASLRDEEGNVYPVQPMTGGPLPGGATQYTLVYQPGGVAGGNVYTSWAALYAALDAAAATSANGMRAPTTIQIDDTFVSPAVIPVGAYNLTNCVVQGVKGGVNTELNLAAGVTIVSTANEWSLYFSNLTLNYLDPAGPCITVNAAPQVVQLYFLNGACFENQSTGTFIACSNGEALVWANMGSLLESLGTGAMVACTGVGTVSVRGFNMTLGDGVHPVFTVAAGTLTVRSYLNTICNAAVVKQTGGAATVRYDTIVPGAQTGAVTITDVLGYVPATPGNWNPAPTLVRGALDQLAAIAANHVQGIQAFGAAAHAITTANLAHTTVTGHTRCFISCSVSSASAGDDIGFQLNIDGNPTGPVMGATSALIGAAVSVAIQYDFTPAAGAHNYSITATSGSAANLTGIQAIVQVQELLS